MDLSGATLAGRYRIERLLGSGGMGQVYEARDLELDRRVAIKTLHPHLTDNPRAVERFRREAQAIAALTHAHVVRVLDFQSNPGEPAFFVMEHLEGRHLGAAIREAGRLPADRVVAIAKQVLGALEAAHRAGIIHRDVKPENVMLVPMSDADEFVKLVDFGIAKDLDAAPLTATGALIGTVEYMPPEQANGAAVDARSDVYAVGACMYHALAGRPPFSGESSADTLHAICTQPLIPLSALCPELDLEVVRIVERAMAKEPAARFASAEAMAEAIGRRAPGSRLAPARQRPSAANDEHAAAAAKGNATVADAGAARRAESSAQRKSGRVARDELVITGHARRGKRRWPLVVALLGATVGALSLGAAIGTWVVSSRSKAPAAASASAAAAPSAPPIVTGSIADGSPAQAIALVADARDASAAPKPPPHAIPAPHASDVADAAGAPLADVADGADASPSNEKPRFCGAHATLTSYSPTTIDAYALRTALLRRSFEIDACFARSRDLAPDHHVVTVQLRLDPNVVVGATPTSVVPPTFAICLQSVLAGMQIGEIRSPPANASLTFTSR